MSLNRWMNGISSANPTISHILPRFPDSVHRTLQSVISFSSPQCNKSSQREAIGSILQINHHPISPRSLMPLTKLRLEQSFSSTGSVSSSHGAAPGKQARSVFPSDPMPLSSIRKPYVWRLDKASFSSAAYLWHNAFSGWGWWEGF